MPRAALAIIIFAIAGLGLPVAAILISLFLRPKKPLREPQETIPYETGSLPKGNARTVGFGFYRYAVLFLLFDLAAVILILAALVVPVLTPESFIAIFVFIIFLSLTILYAMKSKDYLEI